ncbi:MAG: ribose 5-phosphate isomerase B [Defluviitaleaceae bacterium]|nr:ribose 5-phosphate isomerase B [Defluviitaleaceae bacterium]
MKIVITNDHAATGLKEEILAHLKQKKSLTVIDDGSKGEKGVDYPEYALSAAKKISSGECDFGIFLCGTGAGMCIAANKIRGIRAVVCSEPYTARLSREHNDAQILCIGARVVGSELAKMIIDTFLEAKFEGGRHQARVEMFMAYEGM